jgi:hypothetical protein
MGCIGLGAYMRENKPLDRKSSDFALNACISVAKRADAETAIAVGWAIRELIAKDLDRLLPVLEQKIHLLSRQAFRTAAERLERATRTRLTALWRKRRQTSRRHAVEPPSSQCPKSIARKRQHV